MTIELVPKTCWMSNVRSLLTTGQWDALRSQVYKACEYRCEICGGRGDKHPVECHEAWDYDDRDHVQRLVRMIGLCPPCHIVKHIRYAATQGKLDDGLSWLREINGWKLSRARRYHDQALAVWLERSKHEWTLDLSGLAQYGIDPPAGHPGGFVFGPHEDADAWTRSSPAQPAD